MSAEAISAATERVHSCMSWPLPYAPMGFAVGALVSVVATLKAYHLMATSHLDVVSDGERLITTAAIILESALALFLCAGVFPAAVRSAALLAFIFFFGVAATDLFLGMDDCRCFGLLKVSPWWRALFVALVIGCLLISAPKTSGKLSARLFILRALTAAAIVGALSAATVLASHVAVERGLLASSERLKVLRPESWLGRSLPLFELTELRQATAKGRWIVVFFKHDCPKCDNVLTELHRYLSCAGTQVGAALIEIPPYGAKIEVSNLLSLQTVAYAPLDNAYDWIMRTPCVLTIQDGIVQDVTYDKLFHVVPSPSSSVP